jgi:Zn finger protein HypA/HybF involved in hydrogenase expression
MPCYRCGRVQEDPAKGASPWVRAVISEEQVLVCPSCQQQHPEWTHEAMACRRCGSTRLQIQLGMIVCRACGENWDLRRPQSSL